MKQLLPDPNHYSTILFDCDGVILDSNHIKSQAFYDLALPYGENVASTFLEYHQYNGGISRHNKFSFLVYDLLSFSGSHATQVISNLLDSYAALIYSGLLTCPFSKSIFNLSSHFSHINSYVISGSLETELNSVFTQRSIHQLFDGIYGSPRNKYQIIDSLLSSGLLKAPIIFVGDSQYDHQVANHFSFDFVFVSGWTDFKQWDHYVHSHHIPSCDSLDHWLC